MTPKPKCECGHEIHEHTYLKGHCCHTFGEHGMDGMCDCTKYRPKRRKAKEDKN